MKITDIRMLCLSRPHEAEAIWFSSKFRVFKADCPIVMIETDEGIQGISEPSTYGNATYMRQRLEEMKPRLVGKDIDDPSLLPANDGHRENDITNAGIELALWDIRGKAAGKRVADLIIDQFPGPPRQPRERFRLYASAGVQYDWDDNPESVIDEAVAQADKGFTAYKMRIGTHWAWSGVTMDRFLKLLQKVTDAVGDRMELMLEGNSRFKEEQAWEVGQWLDDHEWTWFEEPLDLFREGSRLPSPEQVDAYARLNEGLKIAITGGESNSMLEMFEPCFRKKAYAKIQLDVGVCGLAEAVRIWKRGKECDVPVFVQNWHNGLLTVSNAHFLAALPESSVLETFVGQGPLQWDIIKENPIDRGYFTLPDGPGWGVAVADDLEERFPWIDGPWGVEEKR